MTSMRGPSPEASGHTPGPWNIVRNHRGKIAIVGPRNDGKSTTSDRICNAPQSNPANARLIAAAPDMADALRVIAEQILTATDADRIRLQALARDILAKVQP